MGTVDNWECQSPAAPTNTRSARVNDLHFADEELEVAVLSVHPRPASKTPTKPSAKAKGKQRAASEILASTPQRAGRILPAVGALREKWCRRCAYAFVFSTSTGGCHDNLKGGKPER
ncbi:unnamed protein product [Clonostachys byssicola]|uniref:Uncharacterized protein n=1 Tax=Clonostachys byssicola TaxID=160290 RepID=A0A9N9UGT5_9HYPO|nr:unnamed protein product [Clonostachys byssicola]